MTQSISDERKSGMLFLSHSCIVVFETVRPSIGSSCMYMKIVLSFFQVLYTQCTVQANARAYHLFLYPFLVENGEPNQTKNRTAPLFCGLFVRFITKTNRTFYGVFVSTKMNLFFIRFGTDFRFTCAYYVACKTRLA